MNDVQLTNEMASPSDSTLSVIIVSILGHWSGRVGYIDADYLTHLQWIGQSCPETIALG